MNAKHIHELARLLGEINSLNAAAAMNGELICYYREKHPPVDPIISLYPSALTAENRRRLLMGSAELEPVGEL